MKKYLTGTFFLLLSTFIYAQVGIGTTTPNADAALDINGASGGLLLPRVALINTTSPAPLNTDVAGMTVYNTVTTGDVTPGFYYNDGALWVRLDGGILANSWDLNGNSGTTNGVNFMGTIDDQALDFRTNNEIRARLTTIGQLELINPKRSVLVGEKSGTNSSGINNVGVGYNSLNSGSGRFNVAIGHSAMTKTSGSDYNVAVGYKAMENSLDGADWNTAFGYESLQDLVGGDGNTAIGHLSQTANLEGNNNTSLGYHSLYENQTGNTNVAIGHAALNNNVTGNSNVAIGYRAGYSELGSNKLYINTTDSSAPLIGGDFLNDRAGINYDITLLTHTLNVGGSVKIDTFLNLTPLAIAPTTPFEGDVYYNSALKKAQVYNGSIWENLN